MVPVNRIYNAANVYVISIFYQVISYAFSIRALEHGSVVKSIVSQHLIKGTKDKRELEIPGI